MKAASDKAQDQRTERKEETLERKESIMLILTAETCSKVYRGLRNFICQFYW